MKELKIRMSEKHPFCPTDEVLNNVAVVYDGDVPLYVVAGTSEEWVKAALENVTEITVTKNDIKLDTQSKKAKHLVSGDTVHIGSTFEVYTAKIELILERDEDDYWASPVVVSEISEGGHKNVIKNIKKQLDSGIDNVMTRIEKASRDGSSLTLRLDEVHCKEWQVADVSDEVVIRIIRSMNDQINQLKRQNQQFEFILRQRLLS